MLKLDGVTKMVRCLADPPKKCTKPDSAPDPEETTESGFTLPFIGLINAKSGGRKGEKVMQLLSRRGIKNFDLLRLVKDEAYFAELGRTLAQYFRQLKEMQDANRDDPHFPQRLHLRIIICGGDGTMSWGLSTLDRAMLHPDVVAVFNDIQEYHDNLDFLLLQDETDSHKASIGRLATRGDTSTIAIPIVSMEPVPDPMSPGRGVPHKDMFVGTLEEVTSQASLRDLAAGAFGDLDSDAAIKGVKGEEEDTVMELDDECGLLKARHLTMLGGDDDGDYDWGDDELKPGPLIAERMMFDALQRPARASSEPSLRRFAMSDLVLEHAMRVWRRKKAGLEEAESGEDWSARSLAAESFLSIHTSLKSRASRSTMSLSQSRGRGRKARKALATDLLKKSMEDDREHLTHKLAEPFGYLESSDESEDDGEEYEDGLLPARSRDKRDSMTDLNRKMLQAMYSCCLAPAFFPIPLGTGNDFSRSTGHGNVYPGSANIPPLLSRLGVPSKALTRVDRWEIKFMDTLGNVRKRMTTEMLCYFSVGYTALIALRFQEAREKFPAMHDRPWKNKFAYVHIGARTGVEEVTGVHKTMNSLVQMYVDGSRCRLPKRCRSLVVNNISSMADGVNFWGTAPSQGKDLRTYSEPSLGDGLLEVMASKGLYKYIGMKIGISHYRRLAQAKRLSFVMKDEVAVQLDGEAWYEPAGRVEISLLHQVPCVLGETSRPLGSYPMT